MTINITNLDFYKQVGKSNENFSEIKIEELINQYKELITLFIDQAKLTWKGINNLNFLSAVADKEEQTKLNLKDGYAFVAHYRESTIFKNIYTVSNNKLRFGLGRFTIYENLYWAHQKKYEQQLSQDAENVVDNDLHLGFMQWKIMFELADSGMLYLTTIKRLHEMLSEGEGGYDADDYSNLKEQLESNSIKFKQKARELEEVSAKLPALSSNDAQLEISPFFYPIKDEELANMNGFQLATICLEELNGNHFSSLIWKILSCDDLSTKLLDAIKDESPYRGREDRPLEKFAQLKDWRAMYLSAKELEQDYKNGISIEEKQKAFSELTEIWKKAPQSLQLILSDPLKEMNDELIQVLEKNNHYMLKVLALKDSLDTDYVQELTTLYQDLPLALQQTHEADYLESIEVFYNTSVTVMVKEPIWSKRISMFKALERNFNNLPLSLKAKLADNFDRIKNKNYLFAKKRALEAVSLIEGYTRGEELESAYQLLPEALKEDNKQRHNELMLMQSQYAALLENKIVEEDASFSEVKATLEKIPSDSQDEEVINFKALALTNKEAWETLKTEENIGEYLAKQKKISEKETTPDSALIDIPLEEENIKKSTTVSANFSLLLLGPLVGLSLFAVIIGILLLTLPSVIPVLAGAALAAKVIGGTAVASGTLALGTSPLFFTQKKSDPLIQDYNSLSMTSA